MQFVPQSSGHVTVTHKLRVSFFNFSQFSLACSLHLAACVVSYWPQRTDAQNGSIKQAELRLWVMCIYAVIKGIVQLFGSYLKSPNCIIPIVIQFFLDSHQLLVSVLRSGGGLCTRMVSLPQNPSNSLQALELLYTVLRLRRRGQISYTIEAYPTRPETFRCCIVLNCPLMGFRPGTGGEIIFLVHFF